MWNLAWGTHWDDRNWRKLSHSWSWKRKGPDCVRVCPGNFSTWRRWWCQFVGEDSWRSLSCPCLWWGWTFPGQTRTRNLGSDSPDGLESLMGCLLIPPSSRIHPMMIPSPSISLHTFLQPSLCFLPCISSQYCLINYVPLTTFIRIDRVFHNTTLKSIGEDPLPNICPKIEKAENWRIEALCLLWWKLADRSMRVERAMVFGGGDEQAEMVVKGRCFFLRRVLLISQQEGAWRWT